MLPAPRAAVREVLLVYAAVWAVAFAVSRGWLGPAVRAHSGELIGLVFLATALHFGGRTGLERSGLALGGLMTPSPDAPRPRFDPLGIADLLAATRRALPTAAREAAVALGIAVAVFPPFTVGFYLFHQPSGGFDPSALATLGGAGAWAEFVLAQLVVVALPEEAFFRGYVQTRLADAADARDPALRAPGVLLTQATLFALVHLVSIAHVGRLAVFFPALLFGLLRARRGGIGAALVFHALCNVLSEVLTRGFLR